MADRISGIDVSHYQNDVNWSSVKQAGVVFAFAKATEGSRTADAQFNNNWTGMKSAGIIRGAYHYFHPSQDATAQANFFLQTVSLGAGDLPAVIDIETTDSASNSAIVSGVQQWLDVVAKSTGQTPMIYTARSFSNDHLSGQFGSYPLWIANYGVSSPTLPAGWTTWQFWQYSQSGTVAGVQGQVDQDWFNGSEADLAAFVQSTPTAPQAGPINPPPDELPAASTETYTVQSGDTLSGIASKFDVSVEALAQANAIQDQNVIQVGQVLLIPKG
jgi:lysozyme